MKKLHTTLNNSPSNDDMLQSHQVKWSLKSNSIFNSKIKLFSIVLILLSSIIKPIYGASVTVKLNTAQLSLDTSFANEITNATLNLFRSSSGPGWQNDQCIQLAVKNPYNSTNQVLLYKTFSQETTCISNTKNVNVTCYFNTGESISIIFSNLTTAQSQENQLSIIITKFQNPYSSQILEIISVYTFFDQLCTLNSQTYATPGLTIQQQVMPLSQVSLSSSSNILGDTSSSVSLLIAFTPKTTMSKSGSGWIYINVNNWYTISSTQESSYPTTSANRCTSKNMFIISSLVVGNQIQIKYNNMTASKFQSQIQVNCSKFRNPILPIVWTGFQISIFDNEFIQKAIETTQNLTLDARNFLPSIIPPTSLTIQPSNITIGTFSEWTLLLKLNIPIQQNCFIQLFIPSDLEINLSDLKGTGIFAPQNGFQTIQLSDITTTYSSQGSSLVIPGCFDLSTRGGSPFGNLYISEIQTQNSVRDSNQLSVKIFNDRQLTQLIAQVGQGSIIPYSYVLPGSLLNLSIIPANYQVGQSTNIAFSFQTTHTLYPQATCQIILPQLLSISDSLATKLTVQWPNGTSSFASIQSGGVINVTGVVSGQILTAGSVVSFTILGINNQNSAKDAGSYQITTQNLFGQNFYNVDQQTNPSSYIATPGKITAVGAIIIANPTNSAVDTQYTLTFNIQNSLQLGGYIKVNLPSDVNFDIPTTQSSGSCKVYTCTQITQNSITLLNPQTNPAGSQITIALGGVNNPRSFKPTGNFNIITYDTDGISQIDTGFNISAVMTIPGNFQGFAAVQKSSINGVINTYTFSAQQSITLIQGDSIQLTFPVEAAAPSSSIAANCTAIQNVINLTCSVNGQQLTVTFNNFTSAKSAFVWQVSNIKNPASTKPSSSFTNVNFIDKNGFTISSLSNSATIINNSPAPIVEYSISQSSYKPNQISAFYNITFSTVNPLPTTGNILMTYPSQLKLLDGLNTGCFVTTNIGVFNTNCVVNDTSRSVSINNIFAGVKQYSGSTTISLKNIQNPATNKPQNGFVLYTYTDQSQNYIQDHLDDFILLPQFECAWPCMTCDPSNRNICTTCWQNFDFPQFTMTYPNKTQTCKYACDSGFTTNGSPTLQCQACDPSCVTCAENGTVGDVKNCLQCAQTYPFRLSSTPFCLQTCYLGLYATTNASCANCSSSCLGCTGTADTCTQCDQNSPTPNLYYTKCVDVCPTEFTSVKGICERCKSPCATCFGGNASKCLTCDYSRNINKFLYQNYCWDTCPPGSGPDSARATCFPCSEGCDLCDFVNRTYCLQCSRPNVTYYGGCLTQCPPGWHVNSPEGDGRACRPWKLGDLGTVPYPFLIISLILIIVCLFGLMKKRAILYKNKMKLISPQHTVTCIIVALAPVQFLATIAQWIFSYYYGTITFGILALVVTLAAVIVNITFQIWFQRRFDSNKIPIEYQRKVLLHKMTQKEAKKYQEPKDESFNLYKKQNHCTVYAIYALTAGISYKFNKLFYSFFYDQKMFQAQFTHPKQYRKILTSFQKAQIVCIDLALICIDVTALTRIETNNQLYITLIETLILSLVSIILGGIELCLLKKTFKYTENQKDKSIIQLQDDEDEDAFENNLKKKFNEKSMSTRRNLMGDIIKHVKHNKATFLNNKLDDLLVAFGDRKCKSMLDLGTGWQLEDDPRLVITWPISPMLREDYQEIEIKFNKLDAYGIQGNNVYADVKSKFMGMDIGTGADAGFLEFQDALNRKHGGLMSQSEGDVEERRLKRKNRRRGRKNKYYAQIDHEDDQEAEHVQESDEERQLQVIKEQEEEEENMRKAVASEAKRQAEAVQARKQKFEQEKIAKQAQDIQDANARQRRAEEIELAAKAEELAQIERAAKQAKLSKNLQDEVLAEKLKREQEEKLKREEAIKLSAQARQQYDLQEAERIKALNEEKQRLKIEAEQKLKEDIQKDQIQKQKAIEDARRIQEAKDASEFQEKQKRLREEEEKRALEKEKLRLEKQIQGQNKAFSPQLSEQNPLNQTIQMADSILHDFQNLEKQIDIPPKADLRTFNENDILGDFDRDDKGNVVFLKSSDGSNIDKQGNLANQRGYLLDRDTGAVVENQNKLQMFSSSEMDERGEVPAPFNIEKYNFNPHNILGDFDYIQGKPELMQTKQGYFMDKKGRRVNKHGWMTLAGQGHLVDIHGRKKLDRRQLEGDDIPKMFNYSGKRFDIRSVMGVFTKDKNSQICPQKANNGTLTDLLGRRVNEKGYLVDQSGNIIDETGKVLWEKQVLKSGEFPKIFPFTKFDIKRIQGEFELDSQGNPILTKGQSGAYIDNKRRIVNQKGYLIDSDGNIIDNRGKRVFDRVVLGRDGEIPPVFKSGLLKSKTSSSLSRLMSEIEKDSQTQMMEPDAQVRNDGETSFDSQMEDTPANYEATNQKFKVIDDNTGDTVDEENDDQIDQVPFQSEKDSQINGMKVAKKKKKKPKMSTIEVLPPTQREKVMAGAYGGQAVGSIRRTGIKYEKERLKGSKTFRVNTAEEPKLRAKLTQLVNSASGLKALQDGGRQNVGKSSDQEEQFFGVKNGGFMGSTIQNDSQANQSVISDQVKAIAGRPDSRAVLEKKRKPKPGMQDFEEIFGKEIDQFLEDSEWDAKSGGDKVSQGSNQKSNPGSNKTKLKQLEKQYMKATRPHAK